VQDNYLAELVHITAFERGLVEFFRELPGLLVVFILALLYRMTDSRIFKAGNALMLLGLCGFLMAGTGKVAVVGLMVLFSLGEHIMMPIKPNISMELAKKDKEGESLGVTSALGQAGNIIGFVLVSLIFAVLAAFGYGRSHIVPFKVCFAAGAVLALVAFLCSLRLRESDAGDTVDSSGAAVMRKRFYFAKKFSKFYMLEVFYGARKQVFFTFAPYVLILEYGASASTVSFLMAVSAVFGAVLSTPIGKLIDYLGYKVIMVADTLILIVVCFMYGFAHRIFPVHIAFVVVCVNYVLDAVITLASMASSVYVKTIADSPEEVTATLSTGVSVNHVISILIALLGGWIWANTGIEVLFSMSAFLGLCNSVFAATIVGPARTGRMMKKVKKE
jgi:MFS family permease